MAVGRPVLASRAGGGPAEYLEDERNCLQFAPGDGVGLAHAVLRLASQDKLREALIEGGRLTASRFTEASFNDGLRSELEGVLTKRPAR
jgi:glycosyltransferase involved in cell wall biosynthesis